ncbi:MAG: RNA polymerase sigma factor [Acidimicrobiia bacterium]|nr:RNA polymerase sigma factor [Acidimicrobiia bacterium]
MQTPTAGFTEPFESFYRREYGAMVALAAAVSGLPAASEDIAQEALLRAHRAWGKVSGYDKPGAWLRRITINLASNQRRRASTERRLNRVAAAGRHTVDLELRDEGVWGAVAKLPTKQRAAIALFYLEDRSVAEIAEILDCAPNTAKAHLYQGRQALQAALDREEML